MVASAGPAKASSNVASVTALRKEAGERREISHANA
jgi:hypothetical protein